MNEAPVHDFKKFLSDTAEINNSLNFEPFNIDFTTLKKAFEKAAKVFGEDAFKSTIEKLSDDIAKEFQRVAASEDLTDSIIFASRAILMLLQLEELFDLDWF